MHHGVKRLHLRVRQHRKLVDRFNLLAVLTEVADLPGYHALAGLGGLLHGSHHPLRGESGVRAGLPCHVQHVCAGLGGPEMLADDGDTAFQADDVLDPRHGPSGRIIHGLDAATDDRAGDGGGDQHAGHTHIDTKLRRAIDFAWGIEPSQRLAAEPKILRVLKGHLRRHRLPRGGFCKVAIGRSASAWDVEDGSAFNSAGGRIRGPQLCRGRHQDAAADRTDLPQ
jgi:hypothetical protein